MSESTANVVLLLAESDTSSEEYDSSSASSEDENSVRADHVRMKNFVEAVAKFDFQQFRAHFRISPETNECILKELMAAKVFPTSHKGGREMVNPGKGLLMTIWYLANLETFRQLGDRFDVSRSTALEVVRKVVKYLVTVSKKHINWPEGRRIHEIGMQFQEKQGISGVVGCIDGTHIPIKRPKEQEAYYNRRGFTSIVLQGACDNKKKFIDIFCGEPGSMHDARVFRRSNLYKVACENGLPGNTFLLGDSAYPNLPWLVVPFKENGHLTPAQKQFNFKHSSTRIVIEHAFGLLKGRFRRLKFFENSNIPFIIEATIAACVLHNICIEFDDVDDYEEEVGDSEDEDVEQNVEAGIDRREQIMNDIIF